LAKSGVGQRSSRLRGATYCNWLEQFQIAE
jgi:hypothetical protein